MTGVQVDRSYGRFSWSPGGRQRWQSWHAEQGCLELTPYTSRKEFLSYPEPDSLEGYRARRWFEEEGEIRP